jgi:translocation and assembly module TamB
MSVFVKLTKWIGLTFLALCLIVLLAIGFVLSPMGTQSLISIANDQVESLNIEYRSGGLLGTIALDSLSFKDQSAFIDVADVDMTLSFACLFSMQVCIDNLSFKQIDLVIASSKEEVDKSEAINSLIKSPVLISLDNLAFSKLRVYQSPLQVLDSKEVKRLQSLENPSVVIDNFDVSLSFYETLSLTRLNLENLVMINSPPAAEPPHAKQDEQDDQDPASMIKALLKKLEYQYPGMTIPSVYVPIHFELSNINITSICVDVDEVCLQGVELEAKHFEQSIEMALGLSAIQTKVQTTNDSPNISSEIISDLTNLKLVLTTHLDENFDTRLTVSADSKRYDKLSLSASMDINRLDLEASKGASNSVIATLKGDVDIESKQLPLDLKINIFDLPYSLNSFANNKQVESQINMIAKGSLEQYELALSTKNISVKEFELNKLTTNIGLRQNQLTLDKIKLDALFKQAAVVAKGAFSIDAEGLIKANNFELNAKHLIASANGTGHIFDKHLTADKPSNIKLLVKVDHINYFVPNINGSIDLNTQVESPLLTPKLSFDFVANALESKNVSLESLDAKGNVNLLNKWASKVSLDVSGLNANEIDIPTMSISLNGNEKTQSLLISIPDGDVKTQQSFVGEFVYPQGQNETLLDSLPTKWVGNWQQSSLSFESLNIVSSDVTPIQIDIEGQAFSLEKKCWKQSEVISLCAEATEVSGQSGVAKIDTQLDVMALLPLLNQPDLMAQANQYLDLSTTEFVLNSDLDLTWNDSKRPSVNHRLIAQNILLSKNQKTATLDNLSITNQLASDGLTSEVLMTSSDLGNLAYAGRIFDHPADNTSAFSQHQGSITLSDLTLAKISNFIPQLERVNGIINAELSIKESLDKPAIFGDMSIQNGELLLADMPVKLSDWQHEINFKGRKVDSQGEFHLGTYNKGGKGKLTASVDFNDAFLLDGTLSGDRLEFEYEKHHLTLSPDLTFSVSPSLIKLFGDIDVPMAKIVIETLPEGAPSPSKDIIVVDQEEVALESGPDLIANLNITIDSDKNKNVKLEAFDLKTSLHGDLNLRMINSDLNLVGKVNLLDGEYKAYGQALSIQQGEISFTGQPDIPNLDIRAVRNPLYTADDVVAGISVTGTSINPSVALFSEPEMDQVKQLSYLLTGQDFDKPGESQDANTQLVNTLVSFGVGRSENGIGRLGRKLGVDNLNLQAAGVGEDTQVQISGRLSDKIQISYGLGVFDSVSEIKLRYDLLPDVYLEAVSGMQNALDLYYEIERQ